MRLSREARSMKSPGVVHLAAVAVHPLLAVDAQRAMYVQAAVAQEWLQFVGGHQAWSEAGGAVLAFGRTETTLHLVELQIATAPVVEDEETGHILQPIGGA